MAGTLNNAKRPRYQSNERFDTVDADGASRAPRENNTAANRSLLSTPRATAAAPVGLIVSGFSLTLNPVGPTDNKVRINTEAGVALDADGGLIIKPAGTTFDVTIPVGTYQVYVYFQEVSGDNAKRRFLPPNTPFTEFTRAIDTTFQGSFNVYIRAGNATTIVAEDNVNGRTTPLVCIGVVTNTAGGCTMAGRPDNAAVATIPNGTDITNRLSAAIAPSTPPTTPYFNGSIRTLHEMVQNLAYQIGEAAWKGSTNLIAYTGSSSGVGAGTLTDASKTFVVNELTGGVLKDSTGALFPISSNTATIISVTGNPTAGTYVVYAAVVLNNYGAYNVPAGGVDAAFRGLPGYVTIGNGTTIFGDFDTTSYANANLLLTAAIAALPAAGGTIILKRGVQLAGFNAALVAVGHARVEIVGDYYEHEDYPQLTFVASEALHVTSGQLCLRRIHVEFVGNAITIDSGAKLEIRECKFECTGATFVGAAIEGVDVSYVDIDGMLLTTNLGSHSANGMALRITGVARNIRTNRVTHEYLGDEAGVIDIADGRSDIVLLETTALELGTPFSSLVRPAAVKVSTTDNTTATEIRNRHISGIYVTGTAMDGLNYGDMGHLDVERIITTSARRGVLTTTAALGPVVFRNCEFGALVVIHGDIDDLTFQSCTFKKGHTIGIDGDDIGSLRFLDCTYDGVAPNTSDVKAHTIRMLRVNRCQIRDVSLATSNDFAVIRVMGDTNANFDVLDFSDNDIRNIQSTIAFTGDLLTRPRIFEVDAYITHDVICERNKGARWMANTSGNSRYGVTLLNIDSVDRFTDSVGFVERIVVKDNVIGGLFGSSIDCCQLLELNRQNPDVIDVSDNHIAPRWNDNANNPRFFNLVHISSPATVVSQISINNNKVMLLNASISPFTKNFVSIGIAGSLYSMTFAGNEVSQVGTTQPFDFATAWGFVCSALGVNGIVNLTVKDNTASWQSTSATAWFETKFTGAVTRSNPSGGVPGAGVAWGQNIQIFGG
jgi:hypothetical protein